jgi:hypothetical protein
VEKVSEKYIILTTKETFQTIVDEKGLETVETYHFYFFDEIKATYTVAKVLDDNVKIQLYEKYEGKEYVNNIKVKFFETFTSLEAAHEELNEIVKASGSGEDSKYTKLVKTEETSA